MRYVVGFTGTRVGMTAPQKKSLRKLLTSVLRRSSERPHFHHGDCVGADKEAHDIARELGFYIVIHPPESSAMRSWCEGDEIREPKDYLERNRDIVDESTMMMASPKTSKEKRRSGTWSTVRYSRTRRPVTLLWPGGGFNIETIR